MSDVLEILKWCKESKEAEQYETICTDSISELAELILAEEKTQTPNLMKAYGELADKTMGFIRAMKDLPHHTYTTCKQYREKDDKTNTTLYGPALPGTKLPENIPYMFDVIMAYRLHESDDEVHRALMTRSDGCYEAKDRSGLLEPYEAPNLTDIINKVMVTRNPRKKKSKARAKKSS